VIRESQNRNSKFERLVWPEQVEPRDGFEPVCFDLVGRLFCSEPPELIEWAVALEAGDARSAVEPGAPGPRHNQQAVVNPQALGSRHSPQAVVDPQAVLEMMAVRASSRSARDELVRSAEARDELARSAWREKARGYGAGLGSREVAR
jgi:hypothetical protein